MSASVVHACPPLGSGRTGCCDRPPFELPHTDRMATDEALVTCGPCEDCGFRRCRCLLEPPC